MAKVVTLGEVMLRLSPPGNERFMQAITVEEKLMLLFL